MPNFTTAEMNRYMATNAPAAKQRLPRGQGRVGKRKAAHAEAVNSRRVNNGTLYLTIPIVTYGESNRREHWAVSTKRKQVQRTAVAVALVGNKPPLPVMVKLTRVAPAHRVLDGHDNLPRAFKAIADEIAAAYGVDDGRSGRIAWEYDQRAGGYAVEIAISPLPEGGGNR